MESSLPLGSSHELFGCPRFSGKMTLNSLKPVLGVLGHIGTMIDDIVRRIFFIFFHCVLSSSNLQRLARLPHARNSHAPWIPWIHWCSIVFSLPCIIVCFRLSPNALLALPIFFWQPEVISTYHSYLLAELKWKPAWQFAHISGLCPEDLISTKQKLIDWFLTSQSCCLHHHFWLVITNLRGACASFFLRSLLSYLPFFVPRISSRIGSETSHEFATKKELAKILVTLVSRQNQSNLSHDHPL